VRHLIAWLWIVLAPLSVEARALALVAEWEEPVLTATRVVRPGATATLPDRARSTRAANAVLIGPGLAVTSTHCVEKDLRRLARLTVEGKPARVAAQVADLALLAVDPGIAGPRAKVRTGDEVKLPRPGAKLLHVYWDRRTNAVDSRVVTWKGRGAIRERFEHGMSGSGLYALTGHLVAIAERADGMVLGPQEIAELLRVREARN
jgi:hypothetical protein